MSKVLLDTNILIYSIDEESKYFQQAHSLFLNPHLELYTTAKNISEFLAVVTRAPKPALSLDDALKVIDDFETALTILYPTPKSYTLFRQLLSAYKPKGLNIHDFEIISIGLANQITEFATLNKKDFEKVNEINIHPY